VDGTIEPWCEEHRYEYHSRPKELESVAEKIESGRYESWLSLDDLVACAVVVPTHSHEATVVPFLDAVFARDDLKERGAARKAPDVFRFDSTRWYGRLRAIDGLDRAETIESTLFEVQIRSAFEHAWSVTTHDLVFKGDEIEWRRARLVSQIKASVEQIDMLIDGFEASAELIAESPWPDLDQRAAIRETFLDKLAAGELPSELRPKDWARFAENVLRLIRSAAPSRRRQDEHFESCLSALREFSGDFPLSCSLFQSVMGILAEEGLVTQLEDRYVALVTPDAQELYPALDALDHRFDFP
jgi:hypothetical protein